MPDHRPYSRQSRGSRVEKFSENGIRFACAECKRINCLTSLMCPPIRFVMETRRCRNIQPGIKNRTRDEKKVSIKRVRARQEEFTSKPRGLQVASVHLKGCFSKHLSTSVHSRK